MTVKKKKKKKRKKHRQWGTGRHPVFEHIKKTCFALGVYEFHKGTAKAVISSQLDRGKKSMLPEEQHLYPAYKRFTELTDAGKNAFLVQLDKYWNNHKKIKKVKLPQPPPPPPNAVDAVEPPPPPPNAVSAQRTMGEQFEEDWHRYYEEGLPLEELEGVPPGTTYGEVKTASLVPSHPNKVAVSIRYRKPQDQDEIIEAIQNSFQATEPFCAALIEAKHFRTPLGLWVDLLIHYSCSVVDLYKCIMKCDLVLEVNGKPAEEFGVAKDAR